MKRRDFLMGAASAVQAAPRTPPNILFIMPDQWRGCDMGVAGNREVRTPNLDRLAGESVYFRNMTANTPVCTPVNDIRMPNEATTIAEILGQAGYHTGFVGKWHLEGGKRLPGFIPPQPRRRAYGKGTAIYVPDETDQFTAALATLHPEIRFETPDADLVYLHRAEGARHLYFLANTAETTKRVKATFRDVRGTAQVWNAMDGTVRGASPGPELTIHIEPHASIIVYFDPAAKAMTPAPVLRVAAERAITSAWSLEAAGRRFTLDSLRPWTEFAECKYFSGRGAYRVSADVRVNGQAAGVAWMTPYKLDITRYAKPGPNRIEVGVANLLINRILGEPTPDYQGLEPRRFPKPSEKNLVKEPLPSGLLGPLRLLSYTE